MRYTDVIGWYHIGKICGKHRGYYITPRLLLVGNTELTTRGKSRILLLGIIDDSITGASKLVIVSTVNRYRNKHSDVSKLGVNV